MINSDGSIVTGLWNYVKDVTYTPGDIILKTDDIMLYFVHTQFTALGVAEELELNCGNYDKTTESSDDINESNVALARACDVYAYIQKLAKLTKTSQTYQTITTSIELITTPGLYLLSSASKDLPLNYAPSANGTLRCSLLNTEDEESNPKKQIIQEILDTTTLSYFVRSLTLNEDGSTVASKTMWVDLTDRLNRGIIAKLVDYKNQYETLLGNLDTALNDINQKFSYSPLNYNLGSNTLTLTENENAFITILVNNTFKVTINYSKDDLVGTQYSIAYPAIKKVGNGIIQLAVGMTVSTCYQVSI